MKNKVKLALERIEQAHEKNSFYGRTFMGHSGGKDSTVLFHLAKHVIPDLVLVHNVKPMLGTSGTDEGRLTEMHPETLRFLYETVSKESLVYFMHSSKMEEFTKAQKLVCQLDGSRACEYTRLGKSSEFILDGNKVSRKEMVEYVEHGIFNLNICYPIFDWSDNDVFDYIYENQLKISQEYYMKHLGSDGRLIGPEWDIYWENRLEREAW